MKIDRFTPLSDYPQFGRVEEAAAVLSISRGLVYALIRSGQLEAIRLGRLVRIPRSALEKFAAGQAGAAGEAAR